MARSGSDGGYVSSAELASELRAMRWEVRFLIAAAGLVNFGLAYTFKLPGAQQAAEVVSRVLALI